MRIFSIITAIVVAGALYMLVFERDYLTGGVDAGTAEDIASSDAAPAERDDGARVISVSALKSEATQIDSAVLLRGQTEAVRQVDVQAETSGLITSDPLRKGSAVEAGQLLCEIDIGTREAALTEARARVLEAKARLPEAQGRLLEAEARLDEARINDNAAKQLSADGFASETRVAATRAAVQSALAGVESAKASVETARAGVESATAAVAAAEKEIARTRMIAPFAGVLETDTAEIGALMQPGALCATIIQLNPIKLVGFVPETDVAKVSLGSVANGRTTAGQEVEGTVSFISRSADPETRTFRVEVTVDNSDAMLRDGQTTEIRISAEGREAHLLPASALTLNDSGALGVRLVADAAAQFTPVTILRDTVDGIWVAGLPTKADVIVVGQEFVTDGVAVDVSYAEVDQ